MDSLNNVVGPKILLLAWVKAVGIRKIKHLQKFFKKCFSVLFYIQPLKCYNNVLRYNICKNFAKKNWQMFWHVERMLKIGGGYM